MQLVIHIPYFSLILEMVKRREEKKKDALTTTVKIFERRYQNEDFSGELLKQCYVLMKDRQALQERLAPDSSLLSSEGRTHEKKEVIIVLFA